MLAPLDIPPNLFSKFRYVDPAASGVPANHHIVDLMLGDVSRNLLVHEAWQRGEMPWWDPYTDGGKPLAAEANAVNISDPFKMLLFRVLRFETAYNWIRIIPFLLSGLTAFALLRHFGIGFNAATWGALLYEFAGCNFAMFSGPTVQASFVYYPVLWILWHRADSTASNDLVRRFRAGHGAHFPLGQSSVAQLCISCLRWLFWRVTAGSARTAGA